MVFQLVILIIIIGYLRKSLDMVVTMPDWNKKLWWISYAAIALIIIHLGYSGSDKIAEWISLFLLAGLMYIINDNEEFKPVGFLLTAVIPYLIVSFITYLIKLINVQLYNDWNQWLQTADTFAIIWGFGSLLVTRRQRKELAKARKKAIEEEENNKVISGMRAQLEVQVAERTRELTEQKEELEVALKELKATQSQLIQSEKMASLGELTAGIAHEIQNPLNFVNNFSEVSNELLDEMKAELATGNQQEAIEIAEDVKQNLEKIIHHGKRADAIVKGMLQHSRSSTGVKEPADINALADEYLRLSYQGLRAKDKSFNATMNTDFDARIGKINIIPQDIGRVLLNLFNNAFYAVNQQKNENLISNAKEVTPFEKVSPLYEPTVSVKTLLNPPLEGREASVIITVSDNGNGIPEKVLAKIFQPFFTTKPTGEGTGLGLSMSYDIVKAHGGELKVETKEGEGSLFIIQLPVS
jgi:two-component system NtrC family sensor kinase